MTSAAQTLKTEPVNPNTTAGRRLIALVPAGGVGARALSDGDQAPKQYRLIKSKPMIVWTVQRLLADPRIERVVVGVQPNDTQASALFDQQPRVIVSPSAGVTRAQTVLQTLTQDFFEADDWVLVHDAARPGLPLDALSRLIDACLNANRGGLLALQATDTVKLAHEHEIDPRVQQTLARERIWLAQTPQMFQVSLLRQALAGAIAAGHPVTDEASAMEWAGDDPLLVQGAWSNHKITWPEDFEGVQRWL
uniref:2-C-methyl-D-erythritol 4-phosphate cytidylyltransferase n=1 Tax=Orrella sp. TaxID=1921583 RepID=UPI0040470671